MTCSSLASPLTGDLGNTTHLLSDLGTEEPAGAARTDRPRVDLLGVTPHKVTEGALVRNLLVALDRSHLVERLDVRTQTAVHAQNALVDDLETRTECTRR